MRKFDLELSVGLFILAGILCLGYLSVRLAKMEILGGEGYEVHALFTNVGGLKEGAAVVIAGVDVGRVRRITMENYRAKVVLNIQKGLELQEDAIASIKTKGLIGEKYIQITPGGAEEIIPPGGKIWETEPAVDLEQLISQFAFGKI
ncbi:MAG: outer membrane lipid asymmetry maintenance protein MlaD [Deltaproteobacteria bacterium]|nr:outer membrane lipid asymmetry maintenance protein MlaD [Deltaproteobacteria bacterium]